MISKVIDSDVASRYLANCESMIPNVSNIERAFQHKSLCDPMIHNLIDPVLTS